MIEKNNPIEQFHLEAVKRVNSYRNNKAPKLFGRTFTRKLLRQNIGEGKVLGRC